MKNSTNQKLKRIPKKTVKLLEELLSEGFIVPLNEEEKHFRKVLSALGMDLGHLTFLLEMVLRKEHQNNGNQHPAVSQSKG